MKFTEEILEKTSAEMFGKEGFIVYLNGNFGKTSEKRRKRIYPIRLIH